MSTVQRDMRGKTCLVTGATAGIGRSTAAALAARGANVVLGCRNLKKAAKVAAEIEEETPGASLHLHHLDLDRFSDVRKSAQALVESEHRIDVLVNNAGLAGQRGLTSEGFELAFGTNHLGPFLFTLLAEEALVSNGARIVMVASNSHRLAKKGIDFDAIRKPTASVSGLPEYGVSKLANILFAKELGRRWAHRNVTTYALNPGRIASDIWKRVPWPVRPLMKTFMKSNDEGAKTSVMCSCDTSLSGESGLYYNECKLQTPSRWAMDDALAAELWDRSAEMVGL